MSLNIRAQLPSVKIMEVLQFMATKQQVIPVRGSGSVVSAEIYPGDSTSGRPSMRNAQRLSNCRLSLPLTTDEIQQLVNLDRLPLPFQR